MILEPKTRECGRCGNVAPSDVFGLHECKPMTAKPEQTDEELAAEFMSWPKEGMNYAYEIRIAGTREIEAKLAEEGLAQAYADALYGQTDKLPRDNDHRIALLEMEIELLLTAKDVERLRAIGAVLRGRGGK